MTERDYQHPMMRLLRLRVRSRIDLQRLQHQAMHLRRTRARAQWGLLRWRVTESARRARRILR